MLGVRISTWSIIYIFFLVEVREIEFSRKRNAMWIHFEVLKLLCEVDRMSWGRHVPSGELPVFRKDGDTP